MKTKKIVIAGGSGFLGNALTAFLSKEGHDVKVFTRQPRKRNDIYWDAQNLGDWLAEIEWADVVINLTGKSVNCRYTNENKDEILKSRIRSTAILAKAIQKVEHQPELWLNASSATIYVHAESTQMTEDFGVIGDDFSMGVCKAWEKEFFRYDLQHTRRIALRTSIVLGTKDGAYPSMKRLTKFFMGGKQGNGEQFISWIHITDFCRAVSFLIEHNELVGPVNITAPNPIQNKTFMKHLRESLAVTFGLGQPKWLLELGARLIGTETELLLKSRNVVPEKLIDAGFLFRYSHAKEALFSLKN